MAIWFLFQGPSLMSLSTGDDYQLYLISFLLCALIAAIGIAAAIFVFLRRHANSKDKLSGLKQPDAEASKDYQVRY